MQSGPTEVVEDKPVKEKEVRKSKSPPKDDWSTEDGWDIGEPKNDDATPKEPPQRSSQKKKSTTKKGTKSKTPKSSKSPSSLDTSAVLTPESVEKEVDLIDWGDGWDSSWGSSSPTASDSLLAPSKSTKSD